MRSPFFAVVPLVPTVAASWVLAACGGAGTPAPAPASLPHSSAPVAGAAEGSDRLEGPPSREAVSDGPATAPASAPVPSSTDVAGRTIGALRDAFNAHDAARVAELHTQDCVVETYTTDPSSPLRGREEIESDLRKTFAAFEDVRSAPLRGWVKGNVVVSEAAWTGTMTGPFLGLEASHKAAGLVTLRVMHLTDEGLVATVHEYGDAAGLVAQMASKRAAPPPPILPVNDLPLHAAADTSDEEQLVAWARGLDGTYGGGDPKAVVAAMSDGADYWTNFGGPAIKGKRALEKGFAAWFKAFPDQKWDSTEAWGIDGFAIIEHTMSATQGGRFGEHPATKKAVAGWRRVDILQPAADGTVLHGWGFANVMEMLQQTGALKQPADVATIATTNAAPASTRKVRVPTAPKKQ